jgi:multidrug efflux pump subunit AcrA (membrane-fusion protein)
MSIPSSSNPQIAAAQRDVLAAQQRVDAAVNTATQALDSATTVCAAAGVGTTTSTTPTADQLTACQTATKDVLTAQTAVSRAQQQLVTESTALDTLLTRQATTPATTPSTSGGASRSGSGTGSSSSGSGSSPSSAAGSSPSSADLIAYQKAVDAAAADVAVAEQAIAQGTIVSPIAGTVQAVNLAVGDTVTAGSSNADIVVVGAGGYEVTTTVSVDNVPDVKVGQSATFLPDGSKRPLAGTVASISIAPDSGASTTSYRVVVGLTDPGAKLNNGSTGSVAIVTKSSRAALAVPTSAVTTTGSRHTVSVLNGNTPELTAVEVGVVGDTWTEITGGVKAGQKVVLANVAAPLPGSATTSSSSNSNSNQPGGGRFGGFPGGAVPAGGFKLPAGGGAGG